MSSSPSSTLSATEATPASSIGSSRIIVGAVAAIAVVCALIFGIRHLEFAKTHEETDDAQVEGDISPVLPRVAGYVSKVLVVDNQRVAAGDRLVEIDTQDLELRITAAAAAVESAKADLKTAEASVADARASAAAAEANVATAVVRDRKGQSDLARDTTLQASGAITASQLTDTKAVADAASTELEARRRQAEAAQVQIQVGLAKEAAARTAIAAKTAELDYAKLQATYANVIAPIAGVVSHKSVEPGQYLQAGQTILSIAADTGLWVVANFKETQLTKMAVGQPVEFTVDTYPGKVYHGKIDSISAATGARFALLPPDNASGNYVKVTQRIPVKIVVTDALDPEHPLRAGVSVDATVTTRE
jgi:membrane fusion protein (multidrug efflux system)